MTTPTPPVKTPTGRMKRKHCQYSGCRRLFVPTKPHQVFCRERVPGKPNQCRFDYHKFGAAFGTLSKQGLNRLVKQAEGELRKLLPKLAASQQRASERRLVALEEAIDGRLQKQILGHVEGMTAIYGRLLREMEQRVTMLERRALGQ